MNHLLTPAQKRAILTLNPEGEPTLVPHEVAMVLWPLAKKATALVICSAQPVQNMGHATGLPDRQYIALTYEGLAEQRAIRARAPSPEYAEAVTRALAHQDADTPRTRYGD